MKPRGAEEEDAAAAGFRRHAAAIVARIGLRRRLLPPHSHTPPLSYRPHANRGAELIRQGLELAAWMALLVALTQGWP